MTSFFSRLFDTSGFPPRWHCGEWSEAHGWLHILSDIAIFGAYAAIPMALAFFISRRKDIPFVPIFWLFALFIVSCGFTHLIEATIFWHPWYRLSGVVKAGTAVVSWMTVVALFRVLPSALALPGLARDHRHLTALIAEREQAEAALRESEERFRAIADNIPQLAWLVDSERRVVWFNRVWLDFTGTTLEDNIGCGWKAVLHPDHGEAVIEKFECHLRDGRDWEDTFPLRGKDGQYRWFLSRMKAIRDESGKVVRFFGTNTDITDMRRTEEALRTSEALHRRSEQRFRMAVGTVSNLIWTNNAHGHMEGEQPAWENFTGQLLDEYQGYGWAKAVHPEDAQPTIEAWEQAVAEKRMFVHEHRVRRADGEWRLCSIRAVPMFSEEGAILEWVGVHTDITELREADGLLREREALFSTLIEQSPGGVYVVDDEFRVRHVNPESRAVLASAAPIIGRDFTEVMHIIWGPELGSELADIFRHTLKTGERYISPRFTAQRHDLGREQSYEWETQRVTLPNGRHGVVCYFTDATERQRAEDALRSSEEFKRSIIESSPDCIKVLDLQGNLISLEAGHQLLGVSDTTSLLGKSWIDLWVREEDQALARAAVDAAVAGGEGKFVGFFRTLNGLDKWWSVAVTPIRDHTSQPTRLLAVSRDVTEQRALDDALVARAEELARADRSKDEFLAMLAHELRNPLASLRNAAEILQSEDASAAERSLAQPILRRQIDNMSRMIDDLLDVSRITQGKIAMHLEAVALESVLAGAVGTARQNCSARRQQLELKLPPQPVFLKADATRLEQVFSNLLNNACKYSGDGSLITLSAEVVSPANGSPEVMIRVSDNGIGIEPELLPHIFDLFVQSTRSLDRAHGGLGIGLTLVQRLVHQHGGRVKAQSDGLNRGAEFTVHLPILLEAPQPAASARPSAMRETSRRILIVDDNTDAAHSLASLQRRRGHETRIAFTGPDALTAAAEFLPEVVLLDIGLPGMDGFNVARQLRAMPALSGAFIVAMSGYGREEDLMEAKLAGFDEYLVKPIDLARLSEFLRTRP